MTEKISIEKIGDIKTKHQLFDYIQSNVYLLGSVENMVLYSCPTFRYLMQILYFLPDEITMDVLNGCYFIFPINDHGMHIPSKRLRDRDLIVFSTMQGIGEKKIFKIMLHEIAHFHLRHSNSEAEKDLNQRENEAMEWADRILESVY
jgi:hypothetical protein